MALTGEQILQGLSIEDVAGMLDANSSLRGFVQGYVAELYLKRYLETLPGVLSVTKIPDQSSQKGDFEVKYADRVVTIELKSVASKGIKPSPMEGGFNGTVRIKNGDNLTLSDGRQTYSLQPGQFDILAISTVAIDGAWSFCFMANRYIPRSRKHPDRFAVSFQINTVNTPCLYDNLPRALQDLN